MSKNALFVVLLVCLSVFQSCKREKYFFVEGLAQGTSYHITYKGSKNYRNEIDSMLKAFDKSLSSFDSTSIISRFNRNDTSALADLWFTDVFEKAREVYNNTNGAFDITVGPLIKAWGFYRTTKTVPDSAEIKKILEVVGMNKVRLVNGCIVKQLPGVVLDVNAIAQGYSVDVVSAFLEKQGVKNYVVEIGGELKANGKNDKGNNWRIGIDKPMDGNQEAGSDLQTVVEITGKAMATSGNYRRFFVENGVKYAHHVNPKTGYPSKNNLLSVTLVANDCATADAYATGCLVLGLEKAKGFLTQHRELEGYLIYSDDKGHYQTYITAGLARWIRK